MNEQAWKEQAALEPCPLCAGPAQISSAGFGYYTIHCEACRVVQPGKPRAEAIAAWNTRPLVQQAIADERERCTSNLQKTQIAPPAPTEAQIRADERERCAKVADEHRCKPDSPVHRGTDNTARMIAAAIRSLKESDNGTG